MKILTSSPLKYNYNTNKNKNSRQNFGINPAKIVKTTSEAVTDGMAYGFGWLGTTKPVQKLIDGLKDTNYQRHISAFVGVVLSSFYMIDTAKSKKIKKEDKMPLIVNQATVSVLSTAGAYTLDNWLDKKLSNFVDTIHIANISDPKFQSAMVKYHANKEDFQVMEETAKVLKTPEQVINKEILEAFDTPEQLNQVKEKLEGNKYAQELFEELGNSENPKKILTENYEKNDLFRKLLDERFQLKKKDVDSLSKAVKEGKADEAVTRLVEKINEIPKGEKDKFGKATEHFLSEMKNSKILKGMFSKASFQNSIDIIAETDAKLSKRIKGFKFAKSMMVFAMIYRFISPVFATPVANSISERVEKRKQMKLEVQKQKLQKVA